MKKEKNEQLRCFSEKGKTAEVLDLLDREKHRDLTAEVNSKFLDDFTSLHYAALNGFDKLCAILLEKGAEVNLQSKFKRTATHLAAEK